MATVSFTSALNRFFPGLKAEQVSAPTVCEALAQIERRYPGIKDYLIDEQGGLRKHVNIFVEGELISDRQKLSDPIEENADVLIFQALSGG
ncbi:MAG: MoaD/ThiS family protein [Phaeodactylibacter sp.]|nr:MoaD/ThiS family protein [Phaeodactylibacter sp.]MCB9300021.1 MoaD/ThiS family protein [Lewinellaceae bacterium]HQU57711.1 MoaD/ThiS family protein [Saprospiraceae bacterium]